MNTLKGSLTQNSVPSGSGGLSWGLLLFFLCALVLGVIKIFLGNSYADMQYSLNRKQKEIVAVIDHNAKLEIERSQLTSPSALQRKAEELGLAPAKPNQIRRVVKTTP